VTGRRTWTIRLAAAAEADIEDILSWTTRRFGRRQTKAYAATLAAAITALTEGPEIAGTRVRRELGRGLRTLHVARGRRKGRHRVLFRTRPVPRASVIEILRVLHDAMDLRRQAGPPEE
jgi:toxin ParE1/3/4